MNRLKAIFHIHHDKHWKLHGVNRYFECRCGARKVQRAYLNMHGPVAPGWPPLIDSRGRDVNSSGWKKWKEA